MVEDLESICIQTKAAHVSLVQDKYMDQEHGTFWISIQIAVEIPQKKADEAIVASLKIQFSKIGSFTKKM